MAAAASNAQRYVQYAPGATEAALAERTIRLLSQRCATLRRRLAPLETAPIPTHFVVRDLHDEHILYTGQEITGIVDFGAARIDDPATDLVRLLGTLEPFDHGRWLSGLHHYQASRSWREEDRLDLFEPDRLRLLDEAANLLSAAQWMEWLCEERRRFPAKRTVLLDRWKRFLDRAPYFS